MLRVGLTGGIGAGKSTVARRLAGHGAVVVDADRVAREVVEPGTEGLAAVVEAFGDGVLAADGSLDRAALGALVFADDGARARLEGLLHPRIAARTADLVAAAPPDAVVVHDVPLLVEKAMGAAYHLVVVVDVPADVRVARLVRDRGMDAGEARRRIAAQADDDARRAAADVLLDNAGEPDGVLAAVDALWRDRLVPFEANVRARRAAPSTGRAPSPEQVARLLARLRRAAGPGTRVTADGATLRVVVRDAAAADTVRPALEEAGFPRSEAPGGSGGPVRHGSADPALPATVVVGP